MDSVNVCTACKQPIAPEYPSVFSEESNEHRHIECANEPTEKQG